MSVKLVLLKSGEQLLTDAKQLIVDDEVKGYSFTNPKIINSSKASVLLEEHEESSDSIEVTLSSWMILSSDETMMVPTDWIVTIVEPIESILKLYTEQTNG